MRVASKVSIRKAFGWSFMEQGGSKLVQLVVQIVMARLLAPEVFGILAILLVVINIADVIAQSGMAMALIQCANVTADHFTTAFWLSIAIASVLYALLFFLSPLIATFYRMPNLDLYMRILSLIVFINSANAIQRAYLQKRMDFRSIFLANISAILLSGIVGIAAAILGAGVWSLIVQALLNSAIACIALLAVVPWKPSRTFIKKYAVDLFSYGWKIGATGILNVLYAGLSELVLGRTAGAGQLGYYSQGRKWPNAVILVTTNAVQNVMFPAFVERKEDIAVFRRSIRQALVSGSFLTIPIAFLAAVIAEPFVALLLTETWLPCVPIFQMTCMSSCLVIVQVVNLRAYMALGDSSLYLKLQLIKVISGSIFICGTALVTRNIYWVAFATSVHGIFCVLGIDMIPAKRKIGIGWSAQVKLLLPIFALVFVASVASYSLSFLKLDYLLQMMLQIALFGSIYVSGSSLFKLEGYQEGMATIRRAMHRS